VSQGFEMRFQDNYVNSLERFSVGQELVSGRFYLSIPVSNRLADYEEYYEISRKSYDRYLHDPAELSEFAKKCRRRECDHLLFIQPGSDRGVG
jgi:predicted amidohydrolase YtcJ